MLFIDLYNETTAAIKSNKARSSLTILGIVIGIGSVIAMVSIGQGAQKSIESSIQSIGSNLIMVMPGFQRSTGSGGIRSSRGSAQSLTMEDAEAVKSEVANVEAVSPEVSGRYQIAAKNSNTNTSVTGVAQTYSTVRNVTVDLGSFISEQDVKNTNKVAVLGPDTRDDLFGSSTNAVGKTIRINNMEFRVIGVTKSKGGSGMSNQDDAVYIPVSTMSAYFTGNKYLSTISIQGKDQKTLSILQNDVSALLMKRHKIKSADQADFQIMNQADIIETASSVTGTFTMLLGAIAGISLVVGGIGIMNMMLTTVTERTREIGLRKAIGAKRNDVSNQFLAESVMLTFIGGIFGVILGWISSLVISKFANTATSISLNSILLAFGVSAAIGIIFGYYPARRASKLNPIEALRYE